MARQSNAERKKILLDKFQEWLAQGDTVEEALEKFTPAQYDWLIDQDVDFDSLLLTDAQQKEVKKARSAGRTVKPGGYDKKYPDEKKNLYTALLECVVGLGGEIQEREKQNYRDMDFTLNGKKYKIVLSCPRK